MDAQLSCQSKEDFLYSLDLSYKSRFFGQSYLDFEFMQNIDDALSPIVANPNQYPNVYRSLRRCVVRRFAFAIVYDIEADEVEVIAVFHSRRNPERWKSRG